MSDEISSNDLAIASIVNEHERSNNIINKRIFYLSAD